MKLKWSHIANPFYAPVDPVALNIPNYFKIIKNSMDLITVGNKLRKELYPTAKGFEDDMRLIFVNCFRFN